MNPEVIEQAGNGPIRNLIADILKEGFVELVAQKLVGPVAEAAGWAGAASGAVTGFVTTVVVLSIVWVGQRLGSR